MQILCFCFHRMNAFHHQPDTHTQYVSTSKEVKSSIEGTKVGVEHSSGGTKEDGNGCSEQVRETNGRGKIVREAFTVYKGTVNEYSRSE